MINFVKLDQNSSIPDKGFFSLPVGLSQDFFDLENFFRLQGYLFLPPGAQCLIIFQTDIMATGYQGYALEFAKAMYDKGIAVLTFDNSGSENFGGRSAGGVRDYLPEQMNNDIKAVFEFVRSHPVLSRLKKILGGVSYGAVPITLALGEIVFSLDGLFLIGPAENGWELFEKYYKHRLEDGKSEDRTDTWVYTSKNTGKQRMVPKMFFSKKRIYPNLINLSEVIMDVILPTEIPTKILYAGQDEILGRPWRVESSISVTIEGAQHNFLNKWESMIYETIDLCNDVITK